MDKIVPLVLGTTVIIGAGYLLARLLEHGVEGSLRRIRAVSLGRGSDPADVASMTPGRLVTVMPKLTFWMVMLGVVLLAAGALGLIPLPIPWEGEPPAPR